MVFKLEVNCELGVALLVHAGRERARMSVAILVAPIMCVDTKTIGRSCQESLNFYSTGFVIVAGPHL